MSLGLTHVTSSSPVKLDRTGNRSESLDSSRLSLTWHLKSFTEQNNSVTHTSVLERERERCLVITSVSALIPGRYWDESKLCLTNPLVLRSLHGGLGCTADALSDQRQYFSFTFSLPPSLPGTHALLLACLSQKGLQTYSECLVFLNLKKPKKKSWVVCVFACVQVQEVALTNMERVFIKCCPCAFPHMCNSLYVCLDKNINNCINIFNKYPLYLTLSLCVPSISRRLGTVGKIRV